MELLLEEKRNRLLKILNSTGALSIAPSTPKDAISSGQSIDIIIKYINDHRKRNTIKSCESLKIELERLDYKPFIIERKQQTHALFFSSTEPSNRLAAGASGAVYVYTVPTQNISVLVKESFDKDNIDYNTGCNDSNAALNDCSSDLDREFVVANAITNFKKLNPGIIKTIPDVYWYEKCTTIHGFGNSAKTIVRRNLCIQFIEDAKRTLIDRFNDVIADNFSTPTGSELKKINLDLFTMYVLQTLYYLNERMHILHADLHLFNVLAQEIHPAASDTIQYKEHTLNVRDNFIIPFETVNDQEKVRTKLLNYKAWVIDFSFAVLEDGRGRTIVTGRAGEARLRGLGLTTDVYYYFNFLRDIMKSRLDYNRGIANGDITRRIYNDIGRTFSRNEERWTPSYILDTYVIPELAKQRQNINSVSSSTIGASTPSDASVPSAPILQYVTSKRKASVKHNFHNASAVRTELHILFLSVLTKYLKLLQGSKPLIADQDTSYRLVTAIADQDKYEGLLSYVTNYENEIMRTFDPDLLEPILAAEKEKREIFHNIINAYAHLVLNTKLLPLYIIQVYDAKALWTDQQLYRRYYDMLQVVYKSVKNII